MAETEANELRKILDQLLTAFEVRSIKATKDQIAANKEWISSVTKAVLGQTSYSDAVKKSADGMSVAAEALTAPVTDRLELLKTLNKEVLDLSKKGGSKELEDRKNTLSRVQSMAYKALYDLQEKGLVTNERFLELAKKIDSLGVSSQYTVDKLSKFSSALSRLGIGSPAIIKDIQNVRGAYSDFFGKTLPMGWAVGAAAMAEFIKQLWSFAGDSSQVFNTLTRTGGLMNNSWAASTQMAKNMQTEWVSFGDSMKVMTSLTEENAFMLNSNIQIWDASTGAISLNRAQLVANQQEYAITSAYLAKMGPMYGLTTDQVGKAAGGMFSRFHTSVQNMGRTFDAVGKLAMGTGVSMSSWLELMTNVGNTLRWVNVPLETVIGRFSQLTFNMQMMGQQAGQFWREIQPGEMIEMMKSIVQSWQNVNSSLYLALKPGAIPTTLTSYAQGLQDFYSKEPVEMMKGLADQYTKIFGNMGLSPETSKMFIAQFPGFQEMGRMAPRVIELLTSMTDAQLTASGKVMDTNALMEELGKRFPDQKDNIEAFREAQVGLQEPLQVIARTITMMFRLFLASPILKTTFVGAGAALDDARKLESELIGRETGARRSHGYGKLAGARRGL